MSETLLLIKKLTAKKNNIQEHINDLTYEKIAVQTRIDDLILLPVKMSNTPTSVSNTPTSVSNTQISDKNSRKCGNRAPSGFVKPLPIHDELAEFLGLPKDTVIARTEVTRMINKYIRENGLQDKEIKRNINADEKLKALFKMDDTMQLTYFNIQKYIGHHIVKQI
jgi:chromatin remodeling complex protein RSC6